MQKWLNVTSVSIMPQEDQHTTPFGFSMCLHSQAKFCKAWENMAELLQKVGINYRWRRAVVSPRIRGCCKMLLATAHTMLCTTSYTPKATLLRPGKCRSDTMVHQNQGCYTASRRYNLLCSCNRVLSLYHLITMAVLKFIMPVHNDIVHAFSKAFLFTQPMLNVRVM